MIATLFDIKHFAIHDGPGIRTTVFFKGCPLHCFWCHNPESQSQHIENIEIESKIGNKTFKKQTHIGLQLTIDELWTHIAKDIPFYDESYGGVTFSGGEPLVQYEFLLNIIQRCKKSYVHTAIDTSGYAANNILKEFIGLTDLFLFDIKIIDEHTHLKYTGVSNKLILENLKMLDEYGASMHLRFPLIPGYTDNEKNLNDILNFLGGLKQRYPIDILPFHSYAKEKYKRFNITNQIKEEIALSETHINEVKNFFAIHGFDVNIE